MICYLDSSALVKRYVQEFGSDEILFALAKAELTGTVVVSRVEVTSAFARGIRLGALTGEDGESMRRFFSNEWSEFFQIQITKSIVERSSDLAWIYGLRGYDAIQLAAAVSWQESLDFPLTLATFDVQLWTAAARAGLEAYPSNLPGLLASWKGVPAEVASAKPSLR